MVRVTVFGASGVQGAAQVRALVEAGHTPVAVSRNPPNPLLIDNTTVETCAADFSDTAGLSRSLEGSEVIFLNLPSTSFQPTETIIAANKNVGEAAKKCPTLKLIVFNTSMPVPDESKNIEAQDDRRSMRNHLRSVGLPVVSLQPVCFLDNLLEGWAWPPIRDENQLIYCHKPTLRASWIGLDNLAYLMIACIGREAELNGKNIPVGGTEAVKLTELGGILSKAWGRNIEVINQSVEDFSKNIDAAMRSRSNIDTSLLVEQMTRAYKWYNDAPEEPFNVDMEPVLKELPARLLTIEEWARKHDPFQ